MPHVTLTHLNRVPEEVFVVLLDGVWEHAPWIAEAVAARRPFATVEALHAAMFDQIVTLPEPDLIAFLNLHPDLAGAEARAGTMTPDSTAEQGVLALERLSDTDVARWDELNALYRARFGFPFILCARNHDPASALAAFEARAANSRDAELGAALAEIRAISAMRLRLRVSDPGA